MKIVFMVEEPSMKVFLEIILNKILPNNIEKPLIIAHNGKNDLIKSIPIKLRSWKNYDDRFIIVLDQDSNDCKLLKTELLSLCKNSRNLYLVRIVCSELESWYFGDLAAVSRAYGKNYSSLTVKRKYRTPDKIKNAKSELRLIAPLYQPIDGAKKIAVHMDINNNTSNSFNMFISGVAKMSDINAIDNA